VGLIVDSKTIIPIHVQTITFESESTENENRTPRQDVIESVLRMIRRSTWKRVVIIGDREFGTVAYLSMLRTLGLDSCCRADHKQSLVYVREPVPRKKNCGQTCAAMLTSPPTAEQPNVVVRRDGPKTVIDIRGAWMTAEHHYQVDRLVIVRDAGMKDTWTIATSLMDLSADDIIALYASRWGCESSFKHHKDFLTGLGWKYTHLVGEQSVLRRDRLWLLASMATRMWIAVAKGMRAANLSRRVERSPRSNKLSWHRLGREGVKYFLHKSCPEATNLIRGVLVRLNESLA
jgi:hypothetical protein